MQPRSRIERMGRVYSRSKSKAAAMAVIEEEIEDLFVESRTRSAPQPSPLLAPRDADQDPGPRAEEASRALTALMAEEASPDAPPTPPAPEPPAQQQQQAPPSAPRWFDWLRNLLGLASARG